MSLDTASDTWTTSRIQEAEQRYVIRSWSVQGKPAQAAISHGEGSWFWDTEGNRYLDFQSQLVNLNLGHQHPKLVEAIVDQVRTMAYMGPNFAVRARAELGERIAQIAPGDLEMSFFTTGGAEANENAVRLAQHITGRPKVMARYRSYHGATAGALSLTGDPRHHHAGGPGVPGVVRFHDPYVYRTPSGRPPEEDPVCLGAPHVEEILQYEDPSTIAAIVIETVTGTNGILVPPDGYLASLREVCDRHGIFLICDEVMAGYGRTGEYFAVQNWDVVPDIVTSAKGLNSGYVPLGAMTVGERSRAWLNENKFWGGQTYAGHPLAAASALASLRIMEEENILDNVRARGAQLDAGLRALQSRYPVMGDVRGIGLFYGVEFVTDPATREPLVPFGAVGAATAPMQKLVASAWRQGLYLSANNNVLRLTPPLIVTEDEISFALSVLDDVIGELSTEMGLA